MSKHRKRLPDDRQAVTHKFSVGGLDGYLTVGLYADGKPGEIFCHVSKAGSTVSGLVNCLAIATSMALQHGVPLETLVEKFSHVSFEPSGFTAHPRIRRAASIVDYVFRWMGDYFLGKVEGEVVEKKAEEVRETAEVQSDAPPCITCGSITVRSGSCYRCANCGSTSGCS